MNIKIVNYTKKLGDQEVLNNINLDLYSGNIYGFYGKNGSGKTMLFRAVTSLITPTNGDILIDGESIINGETDLSKIGILIENPGFYDYLTGFQNLELLYSINHKKNSDILNTYLEKVGLGEVTNKLYKKYSLGMRQRLGIAQAIMEDQKIIILDEPTNGLDEQGINDVRALLIEEKKKDKIILIASHNKDDLRILSDKIFHLDHGMITGEIKL